MPAPLLSRDQVVERILQVFRRYGYDGASLTLISQATGLGRSSLYHYFPRGKEDMAEAVMEHVAAFFRDHVLAPLSGPGTPHERMARFAAGLDAFFQHGNAPCLTNLFAIGEAGDKFQPSLAERITRLRSELAALAEQSGQPPEQAAQRAEDVLIALHGSLVLSRGLASNAPFERIIAEMPQRLLGPL